MIATDVAPTHTTGQAADGGRPRLEAPMGKAIPAQHPAVVLRSHYQQLRALLAVAMIAVVGLTAAVVILATNDDRDTTASSATQAGAPDPTSSTRDNNDGVEQGNPGVIPARPDVLYGHPHRREYDGGPEEGTAALTPRSAPATLDPTAINSPPGVRYDGGPDEGTRGALFTDAPSNTASRTRYDGGPEEGSRGTGH
jgi:hypothetical protein